MTMFHVGQKVVCVDASKRGRIGGLGTLCEGAIYTVRWVGIDREELCVRVEEIVRPCGDDRCDEDTPYWAARFRPVIERKTDISIFTEILDRANKRQSEKETAE